ncbi:hypothetical protein [Streptomyces sp. STCH 565 A]|uniref:hypothetical protein n=1 Tax=Streptomyces sp. STCH 565 A TaxID=2950532 RepID=UPI002075647A|nr:hypothetical protein [Streptomyces sp. STCH 565 A]MCM8555357.1 hypothetical protein [Streptomyces sp. STCH 565 A]
MNQPPNYPPPPDWTPPPPARPPWGRFAAWTAGAAIAAFAGGGGLAALLDDGGEPIASETACRAALADNYRDAVAAGPDAPSSSTPPACIGLPQATLERLIGEVVKEYLDSPEAEQAVEDAMREALESGFPSAGP